MKLYIPDLKKAEGKFIPHRGSVKVEKSADNFAAMDVEFQAAYIANRVIVKGTWQATVEGECSRCLEKTACHLKENFREEFVHLPGPSEQKGARRVLEDEQGERFIFKGEWLDLTEYFRQAFFMAQPLKLLCRDDCQGLCPVCGVNRNKEKCQCVQEEVNPRWAALAKIKKDLQ